MSNTLPPRPVRTEPPTMTPIVVPDWSDYGGPRLSERAKARAPTVSTEAKTREVGPVQSITSIAPRPSEGVRQVESIESSTLDLWIGLAVVVGLVWAIVARISRGVVKR